MNQRILASDMDGTFIPLQGNEENRRDLTELSLLLQQHEVELIYVTGRHKEIVLDAIESEGLPRPDWLICDVGTSIHRRVNKYDYDSVEAYAKHLHQRSGELPDRLLESISAQQSVEPQGESKQGQFKRSFYCDAGSINVIAREIDFMLREEGATYHVIDSVDPFTGRGLIDLLPRGVTKAYALSWWVAHRGLHSESVIFAGDSGNDLAALIAGYRAIVVGNADRQLAAQIQDHHHANGWPDRLFLANRPATSGVLDGLRHYLTESA